MKRWFVYPNSQATRPAEPNGFDVRMEAEEFAVMLYGFHNTADLRRQTVVAEPAREAA